MGDSKITTHYNPNYKFPQHSCVKCLNYPCIPQLSVLKSDFGKLGCKDYSDSNIFKCK